MGVTHSSDTSVASAVRRLVGDEPVGGCRYVAVDHALDRGAAREGCALCEPIPGSRYLFLAGAVAALWTAALLKRARGLRALARLRASGPLHLCATSDCHGSDR